MGSERGSQSWCVVSRSRSSARLCLLIMGSSLAAQSCGGSGDGNGTSAGTTSSGGADAGTDGAAGSSSGGSGASDAGGTQGSGGATGSAGEVTTAGAGGEAPDAMMGIWFDLDGEHANFTTGVSANLFADVPLLRVRANSNETAITLDINLDDVGSSNCSASPVTRVTYTGSNSVLYATSADDGECSVSVDRFGAIGEHVVGEFSATVLKQVGTAPGPNSRLVTGGGFDVLREENLER